MIGRRLGPDRVAAASPIDRQLAPDRGELEHNGREPARARAAIVRARAPVKAAEGRSARDFDPEAETESQVAAIGPTSPDRGTVPARMGGLVIAQAGMIQDDSTTGRIS